MSFNYNYQKTRGMVQGADGRDTGVGQSHASSRSENENGTMNEISSVTVIGRRIEILSEVC